MKTSRLLGFASGDRDLWCVAALLWLASAARVSFAMLRGETFGPEATAAVVCLVAVPWSLLRRASPPGPTER
ncbi:MAG: hypothetical protein EOO73_01535 [Myxococcales bacterium]|nr:MAG: hypothetical protein EOO73_01535 [Myxococcales bacterium]